MNPSGISGTALECPRRQPRNMSIPCSKADRLTAVSMVSRV